MSNSGGGSVPMKCPINVKFVATLPFSERFDRIPPLFA